MEKAEKNQGDDCSLLPNNDSPAPVGEGGYATVRYNAVKHGILSRLVVLPHEDASEFADLLTALIEEHRPKGMTELHLVEELAAIIWRKRRVLLAEGAKINEGLKSAVNNPKAVISSAVAFQRGLSCDNVDFQDLMMESLEEVAERQQDAEIDLAATQKAGAILRKGGNNAYEKARRALIPESRDWWDEHVESEEYASTADGLAQFIRETLEPSCIYILNDAMHQPEIKAQTLGKALQAHLFEPLNRYETHLDRNERILAMILKLKELQGR